MLPDFQEFLATLTPETLMAICDDAQLKASQIREQTSPTDKSYLGNQIAVISYTMALELLATYHHWLEQSWRCPE